ncbi:hypothetical protein GCM10007989_32730 [Devosia pacifica]|uniref:Transcription regulator PadR N-terminal domain-containing protein n=1 Tax=Devosia pacifica TaxID=1335967 RepID=A0A918VXI3_9HYPH|nr:PadR family transcriptional regulator [Devosia pacifica]GHA34370.1 hypothetical protein GCM10007989_32730 [Devosia pacifica]
MNVKTLCLSILFEQDATGYEIRRLCVEGEFSYFVEASFGSIYPALARLEDEGLVSSRVEPQEGKPARKVYSITDKGRETFLLSLQEPVEEEVFRSPFLLFARYAHLLPADLVETRIDEHIERQQKRLKLLTDCETDRSLTTADRWVLTYGKTVMRAAENYLVENKEELIALARQNEQDKDAAE